MDLLTDCKIGREMVFQVLMMRELGEISLN